MRARITPTGVRRFYGVPSTMASAMAYEPFAPAGAWRCLASVSADRLRAADAVPAPWPLLAWHHDGTFTASDDPAAQGRCAHARPGLAIAYGAASPAKTLLRTIVRMTEVR